MNVPVNPNDLTPEARALAEQLRSRALFRAKVGYIQKGTPEAAADLAERWKPITEWLETRKDA